MDLEKFVIHGGHKLSGEIEVRGAKNMATPALAASILTKEECIIDNLPEIEDVFRMIEILKSIGAEVEMLGCHKVKIKAVNIDPAKMNYNLVSQLRSSILLFGALFSRCAEFRIPGPGGCIIGARPLDTHLQAFCDLGAEIIEDGKFYVIKRGELFGKKIVLNEFSVTATENMLLALVLAKGKSQVKIAAAEPYVLDLISFLTKMGAEISWRDNHILEIKGVTVLKGANHCLIYDPIEAGTFIIAGAATKSNIKVKNVHPEHLDLVFNKLRDFGVALEIGSDYVEVLPSSYLKSTKVKVNIYPGIPTDLQAPFAVLATQASGISLIHDHMYEGRLRYVEELIKMGANAVISDPHRAFITGPTQLWGQEIKSYDLRAGATLIIAALVAQGESVINNIYQVDRGYECIEKRLSAIGANIVRVKCKK